MRLSALGHDVEVEVIGEGRPMVFLHGLAVNKSVMTAAFEPLATEYQSSWRRIYIDLPGHGGTPAKLELGAADTLVDLIDAIVKETCGETAPCVVGYSYGGYLAQGLVARRALDGLYLVCSMVEADFGKRTVPSRRVSAREELTFSDDPREKEAFEEVAVVQTRAALATFQRVIHPANISTDQPMLAATRGRYAMSRPYMQALQGFDKPVGILCGRDDHWVGWEDAARLARAFRESHYAVLPRCGHLLPFEQPAAFRAHFDAWLSRL